MDHKNTGQMIGSFLDLDLTTPAVYIEAIRKAVKQGTDTSGKVCGNKITSTLKATSKSLTLRRAEADIKGHAVETLLFMEGRKLLGVLFTGSNKAEAAFLATHLISTNSLKRSALDVLNNIYIRTL